MDEPSAQRRKKMDGYYQCIGKKNDDSTFTGAVWKGFQKNLTTCEPIKNVELDTDSLNVCIYDHNRILIYPGNCGSYNITITWETTKPDSMKPYSIKFANAIEICDSFWNSKCVKSDFDGECINIYSLSSLFTIQNSNEVTQILIEGGEIDSTTFYSISIFLEKIKK